MKNLVLKSASLASALVALTLPSYAQITEGFGGSNIEYVPAAGSGLNFLPPNGGFEPQVQNGAPVMRPSATKADFTTTLEFEKWNGEGSRAPGTRRLAILGYSRGLSPESDISFRLPIERVSVDFGGSSLKEKGLDDLEFTYRRYKFDPENAAGLTFAYGLRAYLPTGDEKLPGQGNFSIGPIVSVSKPFGNRTLGYLGGGYYFNDGEYQTFFTATPQNVDYEHTYLLWAGGLTQVSPKIGVQYDVATFRSPFDENHLRFMLGGRYSLSPTRTLQLNFRKEVKADGKAQTVSLGFSNRF